MRRGADCCVLIWRLFFTSRDRKKKLRKSKYIRRFADGTWYSTAGPRSGHGFHDGRTVALRAQRDFFDFLEISL